MRATKAKRKRRACGLCKPHKRGWKRDQTARGTKDAARERAHAADAAEALEDTCR